VIERFAVAGVACCPKAIVANSAIVHSSATLRRSFMGLPHKL
jgi:hypothetical protein